MKRPFFRLIATALSATLFMGHADAARWQSINQRQYSLFHRIQQGVRHGGLTRAEAHRLRNRYWALARLENRYRRSGHGLSRWERYDLNRRFNALSRSIRYQRHDWQRR